MHLYPSIERVFIGPQSQQPYSIYSYFVLLFFIFDFINLFIGPLKPACLEKATGPLSKTSLKNFLSDKLIFEIFYLFNILINYLIHKYLEI